MARRLVLCIVVGWAALAPLAAPAQEDPVAAFRKTMEQAAEDEAFAIAQEAYLYGYPRVEMARRMHNETHRVDERQTIFAPPNRFYYFDRLARPGDGLVIKAPNNDTLYGSAYLDLSAEPVLLRIPQMRKRYYVALVADAAGGVGTRINSRVTGPGPASLLLAGPGWKGKAPAGVRVLRQQANHLWLLMRVASSGGQDEAVAADVLRQFVLAPLSERARMPARGQNVPVDQQPLVARLDPMGAPAFFEVLTGMLRANPVPASDQVLVSRWQRIGIDLQAGYRFDALPPAVQRGIQRAIASSERIVLAAQFGIANNINGWNYSDKIGRIKNDWALNAAIARGGYGNTVEDSVYHQRSTDEQGLPLSGTHRYQLTFAAGQLPPVGEFWSVTAYDAATFDLIENSIQRYSLGDRTPGLQRNPDGSLTLALQRDPPADARLRANWLPVGDRPFYLIMRTYDPAPQIATGQWAPPPVVRQP